MHFLGNSKKYPRVQLLGGRQNSSNTAKEGGCGSTWITTKMVENQHINYKMIIKNIIGAILFILQASNHNKVGIC